MEKRYQIFISSTFADLEEERKKIMEAVIEMDCFPAGMEMFPASDCEQFEYIKGVIDQSDYYILVIGGRYGSTNEEGTSYTEMEFDYAIENGIPVFAFIKKDVLNIVVSKTDIDVEKKQKLDNFRKKAEKGRLVAYWDTAYELKSKIFSTFRQGTKSYPRIGWVKGDLQPDTELLKQINLLRTENEQLKENLQECTRISNEMIGNPQNNIKDILVKCDKEIEIEYDDENDNTYFVKVPLIDILGGIGSKIINEYDLEKVKAYINISYLPFLPDIEGEDFYLSDFTLEEIKTKLYALGIINIKTRLNREYISLTSLGNQIFLKTVKF